MRPEERAASVAAGARARRKMEMARIRGRRQARAEQPTDQQGCTCGRGCQRCADHDPRDRRDHGHLPRTMCPIHATTPEENR